MAAKTVAELSELSLQTFCTFPREFSSFRQPGAVARNDSDPDTGLSIYSRDVRSPVSHASPPDARSREGPVPWPKQRSALHGHAAASTDGHVSHDANRLASARVRRAAAARDRRSADTVSPVPKYISSGVCP